MMGAMMQVTLKKYGNSTVAVLPPSVLKDLGLSAGNQMTLDATGGQIVLTPKRSFKLADMISECDLNAAPPADMKDWDNSDPVGQEVW
jgi:antitoxin ChpS